MNYRQMQYDIMLDKSGAEGISHNQLRICAYDRNMILMIAMSASESGGIE